MINREEIIQLIFRAIDEVNQLLPPERRLQKTHETILSDRFEMGGLDSLGMVNFIIALEQVIREETQVSLSLADDLTISQEHNPFETVAALADDINLFLKRHQHSS
jgi:acyl carrier protein